MSDNNATEVTEFNARMVELFADTFGIQHRFFVAAVAIPEGADSQTPPIVAYSGDLSSMTDEQAMALLAVLPGTTARIARHIMESRTKDPEEQKRLIEVYKQVIIAIAEGNDGNLHIVSQK